MVASPHPRRSPKVPAGPAQITRLDAGARVCAVRRPRGPGLEQHSPGRLLEGARGSLQLLVRLLHRDHNPDAGKYRHRTWSESSPAPASARQVLLGGGAASSGPAADSPSSPRSACSRAERAGPSGHLSGRQRSVFQKPSLDLHVCTCSGLVSPRTPLLQGPLARPSQARALAPQAPEGLDTTARPARRGTRESDTLDHT